MQLQLANQAKVQPIGHISNLVVDVEGMKTYADFDVIEVVEDGGSYLALLGIGWANENICQTSEGGGHRGMGSCIQYL